MDLLQQGSKLGVRLWLGTHSRLSNASDPSSTLRISVPSRTRRHNEQT